MLDIPKKLQSYRQKISRERKLRRAALANERRTKLYENYLSSLAAKPSVVLVGANPRWGGVRHHVQAIKRFSSLDVNLVPGEGLFGALGIEQIGQQFFDLFREFSALGTKVVHSHVFPWYIEWCRDQQRLGKRWIHTYHLNYYSDHAINGLKPWQAEINRALLNVACHADVCLAVSKWQVEELQRAHGITAHYLPNGADLSICDMADAARFTRKTGLAGCILYVGRNDPVKNPADFVRLATRLPEFQFAMIGKGLSNEVLRTEWQVDSPGNLRIFESMTHKDVQDAIAACSVLVVTSKREGMPTLVLEAMAQGKAVVVPDELGCMEAINYGEVGLIYERSDIDDLEKKVIQAMSASSHLGHLARQRVLAEYDWRIIAPRLDEIYRGVRA